jgi:hypothetical protein
MPTWAYVLIGIPAAAVIAAATWTLLTRRRSESLKSAFASEYDHTVASAGSRREAEHELRDRQKRREKLVIVPLSAAAHDRYADRWQTVQAEFVDSPAAAVRDANQLVQEVMNARGYPVDDFEQQAADISVDYPDVVSNYRAAFAVCRLSGEGAASTEDLRQAMRHYRSLFDELLSEVRSTSDEQESVREPVAR